MSRLENAWFIVNLCRRNFGAEFVEEQRADDFEDVALASVMRANLAALFVVHDGLKERAEDGGRDARPVLARAAEQGVAHVAVEIGKRSRMAMRAQPVTTM